MSISMNTSHIVVILELKPDLLLIPIMQSCTETLIGINRKLGNGNDVI